MILPVTRHAIIGDPLLCVAMDATTHARADHGPREWTDTLRHVSMAGRALDPSDSAVAAMGEVDMARNAVDLAPWDGHPFRYVIDDLCLFCRLTQRFLMALRADVHVWNRGPNPVDGVNVAVDTLAANVLDVKPVIELDGL